MIRIHNWDVALFHWAEEVKGQGFKWGETDCASLVRESHSLMYGSDLFRGVDRYRSLRKAAKVLGDVGPMGKLFRSLGAKSVGLKFAQNGDIICARGKDDEGLPRLGVIVNGRGIVSQRKNGVTSAPIASLAKSTKLWRVPNE